MLFIAFYIAAQISISDVTYTFISKITYKPYPIVIVCLLSYIIYSGLTCMLWLKLTLFVMLQTTASLFWSCQVYIPSMIHISKRIHFNFYLYFTLWAAAVDYKSRPKNHNPNTICNFSHDCIFKIAHGHLCRYPGNTGSLYPHHTIGAFDFKRRCTEWSVYDIKVPREPFESIGSIGSLIALSVLWCHTLTILCSAVWSRMRLTIDNLPCCDDGKKLGSNLIKRLICVKNKILTR